MLHEQLRRFEIRQRVPREAWIQKVPAQQPRSRRAKNESQSLDFAGGEFQCVRTIGFELGYLWHVPPSLFTAIEQIRVQGICELPLRQTFSPPCRPASLANERGRTCVPSDFLGDSSRMGHFSIRPAIIRPELETGIANFPQKAFGRPLRNCRKSCAAKGLYK